MVDRDQMKFVVAPHIVEDLGLNLYTDLPRVLVEYVANAHDADSPHVDVGLDIEAIRDARKTIRDEFKAESLKANSKTIESLASRTLPENLTIEIEDHGHGMSRADLKAKFLIAGRRRRQEEPDQGAMTKGGRPLMGRKGLGKLAGFGVAKTIEITSRAEGENHATRITLRYEDLVKARTKNFVTVPDETLADGGGFPQKGTRVVLSRLLYDPLKSQRKTIENQIAEHFELIKGSEFLIRLNKDKVHVFKRSHSFAWPSPDTLAHQDYASSTLDTDEGPIDFSYRIRFVGDRQALPASRRGIRVYVGRRLAAAPSLLDADTNMHGFRMTDYMDGVAKADFLDDKAIDYIATDRQSLRWDTPLLGPLHSFLSDEIKAACAAYQKQRDKIVRSRVKQDAFTLKLIEEQGLSKRDRTLAFRIATHIAGSSKQSVEDPLYQKKLPVLVEAIGHGNVLSKISELADIEEPDLRDLVAQVALLTRHELEQFASYAKTRLKAIETLSRIVQHVDFHAAQNEKELQKLFERAPWLLDGTFTQFLTADQPQGSLFKRLAQELEIAEYAPAGSEESRKRPDLVFLLANASLARLVIVELKSANTPLDMDHLTQLKYYMERADSWLKTQSRTMKIEGHLVGSLPKDDSKAQGAIVLLSEKRNAGPDAQWSIRDYLKVLEDAEASHSELLSAYESIESGDA